MKSKQHQNKGKGGGGKFLIKNLGPPDHRRGKGEKGQSRVWSKKQTLSIREKKEENKKKAESR